MGRLRDPAGIAALRELRKQASIGNATFDVAVERIAVIMAAKDGLVAGITPGDCIELLDCSWQAAGDGTRSRRTTPPPKFVASASLQTSWPSTENDANTAAHSTRSRIADPGS